MKIKTLIAATAIGALVSTGAMAEGIYGSGMAYEKSLQRCGNLLDSLHFNVSDMQLKIEAEKSSSGVIAGSSDDALLVVNPLIASSTVTAETGEITLTFETGIYGFAGETLVFTPQTVDGGAIANASAENIAYWITANTPDITGSPLVDCMAFSSGPFADIEHAGTAP